MSTDELLTINEVAQELRVNRRVVRRLIDEGAFRVTKSGQLRIYRSSLTAYLDAHSTPARYKVRRKPRPAWVVVEKSS